MASKNGSKVLVSLLQYMKNSNLDNEEIEVKDDRIVRLDEIVREVKESEEWEEVQMTIYDLGVEQGVEQGIEQGIEQKRISTIKMMLMDGHSVEEVTTLLHENIELVQKVSDELMVKG